MSYGIWMYTIVLLFVHMNFNRKVISITRIQNDICIYAYFIISTPVCDVYRFRIKIKTSPQAFTFSFVFPSSITVLSSLIIASCGGEIELLKSVLFPVFFDA